jgi:branched-chain amino acid transport system substrate-binding protein
MQRRTLIQAIAGVAAPIALGHSISAFAQPAEVEIGLIAPLSGPFARQGDFMLKGAELAVAHINAAGGIKALKGAKIKLVPADAGESTEKAKNAAQRLVAEHPNMVGATGAWLSSFTLAVSEVTERAGMPLVTVSFADQVTARGFKYLLQTSPSSTSMASNALPAILKVAKSAGASPKTVAAVLDNSASPIGFMKGMRDDKVFEKTGLDLKLEEVFTPPLADAGSIVQKVRSTRPDLLLLLPANIPDLKLVLERLNEVGMGSRKVPMVANGAHMGSPDLLKVLGKERLEGIFAIVGNWGAKGQESVIADFSKKTGEPWMPQDAISTYGDIWFFKEALEQVGAVKRDQVMAALRDLKNKDAVARFYSGNTLKFDPSGKRIGAEPMVLQWQDGVPQLVYPLEAATAKARWPKTPQ